MHVGSRRPVMTTFQRINTKLIVCPQCERAWLRANATSGAEIENQGCFEKHWLPLIFYYPCCKNRTFRQRFNSNTSHNHSPFRFLAPFNPSFSLSLSLPLHPNRGLMDSCWQFKQWPMDWLHWPTFDDDATSQRSQIFLIVSQKAHVN